MDEKTGVEGKKFIPKGFLRAHILAVLREGDAHGYEIRNRIMRETGFWKPSFGTLYPALKSMEKEGLVVSREERGKKVYRLTQKGSELAEKVSEIKRELREKMYEMISVSTCLNVNEVRMLFETFNNISKEKLGDSGLIDELNELIKMVFIAVSEKNVDAEEVRKVLENARKKLERMAEMD